MSAAARPPSHMEHPRALAQPAGLMSLGRLHPCLRNKAAYPKVLVDRACAVLLLHVEGGNVDAGLPPCIPAGALASRISVPSATVGAISAANHRRRLTLQAHAAMALPRGETAWIGRGRTSPSSMQQRSPTWLHRTGSPRARSRAPEQASTPAPPGAGQYLCIPGTFQSFLHAFHASHLCGDASVLPL